MHKLLKIIVFTMAVSGCQGANQLEINRHQSQALPAGATIALKQALHFSKHVSRLYVQHGRPMEYYQVNEAAPWCKFYLFEPASAMHKVRIIEPDEFTVQNSYHQYIDEYFAQSADIKLASNADFFERDLFPEPQVLASKMKLYSARQPQVVELTCGILDDPYPNNFLTINTMQRALGNVAKIHLP